MRRKNSTTKSNSEKKIEELYREALRSVKEGCLIQKQPSEEPSEELPVNVKKHKNTIDAQLALDQALKRQVERRRQRKVLSVQVSPLSPFYFKTEGNPRTVSRSSSEGESSSSCSRDFLSHEPENHVRTIEETLLVLPLRTTDEDSSVSNSSRKTRSVTRQIPPIYRTPLWHETIRLRRCASIPPRGETWNERGKNPLAIWREELHSRSTKSNKDTMSLAAKRLVHSEQRAKKRPFMHNKSS
ncbi:hypothetical protein AC249_AIPGENE9689 [Exaiptasia diaphana]|nr:hypothetical protein AC249_AIPGENE9689 [Exaiptasia diaphana]